MIWNFIEDSLPNVGDVVIWTDCDQVILEDVTEIWLAEARMEEMNDPYEPLKLFWMHVPEMPSLNDLPESWGDY